MTVMKKLIALLLALALLAPCAALAEDEWIQAEAEGLAQQLWKLCNDPYFVETMVVMPEAQSLAGEMAAADFTEPSALWRVAIPTAQELYDMLASATTVDDDFEAIAAMSDLGFRELARRLPASAVSIALNTALSEDGIEPHWILFSSVLSTGKGYVEPEGFEPCLLLMDYPGSFGVAVSFSRIGEGVISATAQPVPSGMMTRVQGMLDELEGAGIHLDIRRIIRE